MSGAQRTRRSSTRIQLSPKQANIYTWVRRRFGRSRVQLRDLVLAAFHPYICTMHNELNRRELLIGAVATTACAKGR